MKWSWRLATFAGIDLKIHVTFILIIVLGAAQWSGYGLAGMVFGAVLMALLFACVTLHEFGHAIVAQRLEEAGARVAAVYDRRGYLGLVNVDDIAEAYTILAFMQRAQSPVPAPVAA